MSRVLRLVALLVLWASAAVGQTATPMGSPTEFPQGGITRMARWANRSAAAGSFITLDSVAVGNSGVVRSIVIQNVAEDTLSLRTMYLVIKYDGSAVSSDSFALTDLFAYENLGHKAADTLSTYHTEYWSRPLAWRTIKGTQAFTLHFRYPIPYTNGIVIRLHSLTTTHTVWTTVERQTQLPACWNRNYRFHVSHTDSTVIAAPTVTGTGTRTVAVSAAGVVTGTNTTFSANHLGWALIDVSGTAWDKEIILKTRSSNTSATIFPTDVAQVFDVDAPGSEDPLLVRPSVFFRRATGKVGYVVSTVLALNATVQTTLEACPRFYLSSSAAGSDGVDADVIGSGTEDWFAGVNYTFAGFYDGVATVSLPGASNGRWIGVTAFNNDSTPKLKLTGYRIFQTPLAYTNGCSATWANYDTDATARLRATIVYYERIN